MSLFHLASFEIAKRCNVDKLFVCINAEIIKYVHDYEIDFFERSLCLWNYKIFFNRFFPDGSFLFFQLSLFRLNLTINCC